MLAIDAARSSGFRDSLYYFRRNALALKLSASQQEKEALIQVGKLGAHLKTRSVTLVTARSAYKLHGAKMIIGECVDVMCVRLAVQSLNVGFPQMDAGSQTTITKIAYSLTSLPKVFSQATLSASFRIPLPLLRATFLPSLRQAKRSREQIKVYIVLEVRLRFSVALGGVRLVTDRIVLSGRVCCLGRVLQRRTGCGRLVGGFTR